MNVADPGLMAECLAVLSAPVGAETSCAASKARAKLLEATFTSGVMLLKRFPAEPIRELAKSLWDVIGNGYVRTAVGPDVPSLTFIGIAKKTGEYHAAIVIPHRWSEMVVADDVMQGGALVYNGSKAVDFYNHRFDEKEIEQRALMYEAEFLLEIRNRRPLIEWSDYQKHVLKLFPRGLKSSGAKDLVYDYQSVRPMAQA